MNVEVPETRAASRSAVRGLASRVSFYLVARAGAGVLRFVTVLWIVRAVSPSTFGILATLWTPLLVVLGACDLGVGMAAVRLAPERESELDRNSLFATMLWARAVASLVVTLPILAFREELALWLTGTAGNGEALFWLALARQASTVLEGFLDELRARDAMRAVSGLVFLATCVTQVLAVLLTVVVPRDLEGLVWARFAGEAVAFAVAAVLCARALRERPSLEHLRRLLALGWPFGLLCVLATLRGLDRPLIGSLTSLSDVAAYELSARLAGPVGLANIALGMVLEPFVYRHAASAAAPPLVDLYVRAYVTVFSVVAMALCVIAPEGITVLAPAAYRGAIRILPALVFATACEGLLRAAGIGADLAKRTRIWAGVSFLVLAIGMPLTRLLVPRVGTPGVGFAWLAANAMGTLVVYRGARKVSGIALPVERGLSLLIVGAALGTTAAWEPWPLVARVALFAGFAGGVTLVMGVRGRALRELVKG